MYFVFCRFSSYIYCFVTHRYATKVADKESLEFLWSTKSNPLHKVSFDNNVTFSWCSASKPEDNKYTKVSIGIQESA